MNGGELAWAAAMCALIVAYLAGFRSYGLSGRRTLQMVIAWIGIIGGGYFLVSWITGVR